MKKLLLLLPLLMISCFCFAQNAKPNKVGLVGDFVGFFTFGGIMHGYESLEMYCSDSKKSVSFISGFGIKNPPKVKYDKLSDSLIHDMTTSGIRIGKNFIFRVNAKSVFFRYHGGEKDEIVWTPTKITLISTSSTIPK